MGGRYFDYDRVDDHGSGMPSVFCSDCEGLLSQLDAGEDGTTFKANLSFTPSEDTLIYAQWSEGFRLGRGQSVTRCLRV